MTDMLTPGQKAQKIMFRILLALIVVPVILFSLYVTFALNFVYAKGERAGYLQKFSNKGWVFKTWEGELAMVNLPGAMPEIFYFTVRDQDIAKKVSGQLGQRVTLYYDQHRGIPGTWIGETQYFLTDIQPVNVGILLPSPSN